MSTIKFPPLHKGVTKYGDVFVASDYVCVVKNHALVCHPNYIVAINLQGLFAQRKNPDIEPDYAYEGMLDILDFLDGKFLSASFWNELVTAPSLAMSDDDQYIVIGSRGTSKELHYVPPVEAEGDEARKVVLTYLESLKRAKNAIPLGSSKASISMEFLLKLNAMTNVKGDTIILEQFGENKPIRFSFGADPNIFGILGNNYDYNDKLFLDQALSDFIDSIETEKIERLNSRDLKRKLANAVKDVDVEFEMVMPNGIE